MIMKKENDMIKTLGFLSVQLEDSETELINAIAPGTFPDYDRPRKFNNPRRMMETDEPRYKPGVVKQVVKTDRSFGRILECHAFAGNYICCRICQDNRAR